MDRCKIAQWEVVWGAGDRVTLPCLMHTMVVVALIMPDFLQFIHKA